MGLSQYYDVIVIGAGMGGLTSAGLLAKAGQSVLLLEQHDRPGGYAHSFKRKHYLFDAGVHLTSGCGLEGYAGGQVIGRILRALDIDQQVHFIRINPFAYVDYQGVSVQLPLSIDAFVNAMADRFPDQIIGLRALLTLCLNISEQAAMADDILASQDAALIQQQLSLLIQYRHATLADVWGSFIQHPQLQGIFATQWPYLGLPPSQVSFIYWSTMLIGYLVDGAYYCQGGFQKLAETLVQGLLNQGGRVCYRTAATKIKIVDQQVQGVWLASGEYIKTKILISNADFRHTVYDMIGETHFPTKFIRRLNNMQVSLSIFVVYIATNLDLVTCGGHHEAFYYSHLDHEDNFRDSLSGRISWLSVTIPTLVDKTLAPNGNHIMMLTTLIDYDACHNWSDAKPGIVKQMLDLAEQQFPGLQAHILVLEAGSPATLKRYTGNYKGSAYGWANTPAQSGAYRFQNRSPIRGLYFAGHWVAPGGGVYGACFSGMQAAKQILGIARQADFWQFFTKATA